MEDIQEDAESYESSSSDKTNSIDFDKLRKMYKGKGLGGVKGFGLPPKAPAKPLANKARKMKRVITDSDQELLDDEDESIQK